MDLAQFDAVVDFVRGNSSTIDEDHVNSAHELSNDVTV